MTRRTLGGNALSLALALVGCTSEPQHASHAIQSDPVVGAASDGSSSVVGAGGSGPEVAAPAAPSDASAAPSPPAPTPGPTAPSSPAPTPNAAAAGAAGPVPADPGPSTPGAQSPASSPDESDAGAPPPATRGDGCSADAPLPVDRVRVLPASGEAASVAGARFQGSNDGPTTNFVDLAMIEVAPAEGAVVDFSFENAQLYRYIRYYAPPGSQGGVAELELYHGATRLLGAAFGTANAVAERAFGAALDGDPTTYASLAADGGGYVGLDISRGYVTEPVAFTPPGATTATAVDVMLTSATADAAIRYTLDGSDPTGVGALHYSAPLRLGEGATTIRAVAKSSCRFDSAPRSAAYTVAPTPVPVGVGLKTYHVGNSLTDTINPWLEPIADSSGVDHVYARWTIPGAPIGWLAEHQGEGFEDPEGAASFDSFVRTFAPIDHLSLQPFSDPDFESQGGAATSLLTTALRYSPDIQFWIYAQWPGRTEWTRDAFANGGGTVYPDWQVPMAPTTWEEATRNEVLYHEAFADYVDARVGGKPLLIVPGGLALVEVKRQMDAGEIAGLGEFWATMFEDEIHLAPPAQYLVALVFYACLYRTTPEGRVTHDGTGLTPEQAAVFQRIAWSIASAYPRSGLTQ